MLEQKKSKYWSYLMRFLRLMKKQSTRTKKKKRPQQSIII